MLATDEFITLEAKVSSMAAVCAWVAENIPVAYQPCLSSRETTTKEILVRATFLKQRDNFPEIDLERVEHYATLFRLFLDEQ